MQTNIRGLVERLDLPATRGLMPLFEAISNSIDAIQEKTGRQGVASGTILVKLLERQDLARTAGDEALVIDGFEIRDDGAGFTVENMRSFGEAYSRSKVTIGGKGVGRFTFLKVFSDVRFQSVFEKEGERFTRSFGFSIEREIEGADGMAATQAPTGTTVTMVGLAERYRGAWPAEPEEIARRVVAHFLIRFAARSCPAIILRSPLHEDIDLHRLFQETVQTHIEERSFQVGQHSFGLQAFRNRDGRGRHEYHLCSSGREVTAGKLKDLLPELPDRFLADDQAYTFVVLVTGEYLDEHANQERTQIAFETEEELALDETLVTRHDLNAAITESLRGVLAPDLKQTHDEKIAQITAFVERAPEYRVLTHDKYRQLIERRIQPGLSEEKLDEALLRLRREIEDTMRKEERHVAGLIESETFEYYQERMKNLIETMNDVGKSKLADHVAHRRTIIDLVDRSLKRVQSDAKYPFENVLHKMIFPMGVSSKDIFFDQQNLWLIDERLSFHTLLTSDKKLNKVRGLERTSGKEPDIFAFIYDTPVAIAEPDNVAGGGVVIIEFKRPGRNDYDKDPADQIVQRFVEIKNGGVTNIDGRGINPVGLRYIGYLIADLTPTLRRHVDMRYLRTADGEGYFHTLAGGNGYVEIISYDKLMKDAKGRNRALFEKLELHKH